MRGPVTRADWTSDPRPDLHGDTRAWVQLLGAAYDTDDTLFGCLHAMRCLGARVGPVKLTPPATKDERVAYLALREQLVPHADWLRHQLTDIRQSTTGETHAGASETA